MKHMVNGYKNNSLFLFSAVFAAFLSIFIIQGCSSSSSSVADENPDGYFTGSASVKEADDLTDLAIADLQGMVSGNRFMFMSVDNVLLYDGTITNVTGSDFTGTVNVYKDGVLLAGTTTVAGTITSESSITGTLTGAGAGSGTFSLTYGLNNADSELTRVAKEWRGPINGASTEGFNTIISGAGALSRENTFNSTTPVLAGCVMDVASSISPISGVNIYSVNVVFNSCTDSNVNGTYTGFTTTLTAADIGLLMSYSNGSYSGSASMVFEP
ncbi:MAG: hypothetical protein DIZ80_06975 [endosymbiont of Galathealinum brachiosum]|uniref:Uncharacterized protein n=1 Tax=endosymbiont of Galathealinum brachiosum TaxID=2200906 RepID=A0A370DG61_9GAMM|nr:MAG: hypothetical protein DIZ80_06975 [endosymbiont of Galathealinum brachiosum]